MSSRSASSLLSRPTSIDLDSVRSWGIESLTKARFDT